MSHNINKLGAIEPSRAGVINPTLASLSDVSGTPIDNQILGFNSGSSTWGGIAAPGKARIPILSWVRIGSFNTSPYNYDVNDNVCWRNGQFKYDDSTYLTKNNADGTLTPGTLNTTAWTAYYTLKSSALNGKTILCEALHRAKDLTGTEYIRYQWGVGSGRLATYTAIGNIAEQNVNHHAHNIGIYTVGASDINLSLKVVAKSGTMGILQGARALPAFLQISILS